MEVSQLMASIKLGFFGFIACLCSLATIVLKPLNSGQLSSLFIALKNEKSNSLALLSAIMKLQRTWSGRTNFFAQFSGMGTFFGPW